MAFRPVYRPDDPQWAVSTGNPAGPELLAKFLNPNKGTATKASDGHAIPVVGVPIATGESFERGVLVQLDNDDKAVVLPGVTSRTYGVALEEVVAGASLGVRTSRVSLALAQYTDVERTNKTIYTRFATKDVNGTVPTTAHVGARRGIGLSGGEWFIDIAETVETQLEVVGIDTARNEYIVCFNEDSVQA